jgi:hypothetical protein
MGLRVDIRVARFTELARGLGCIPVLAGKEWRAVMQRQGVDGSACMEGSTGMASPSRGQVPGVENRQVFSGKRKAAVTGGQKMTDRVTK